jgi:hypothetical protein
MIELINEAASSATIRKTHAPIFAAADKLWQLASTLIVPGPTNTEVQFHVRWVALAYHARQMRAFRAVVLLLERGLVPEAQPILRAMIETRLHLSFLVASADAPTTARQYIMWEFANDEKLLTHVKEEEKAKHAGLQKTLSESFPEEKERRGKEGWEQFRRQGPPMMSTFDLAKKFGFEAWYNMVYRRTSGAVHAFNLLSYARPNKDDLSTFVVNLAPVDDGLDMTLDAAIALLIDTSLSIDKLFTLGKEGAIRELDEAHAKWLKEKLGHLD